MKKEYLKYENLVIESDDEYLSEILNILYETSKYRALFIYGLYEGEDYPEEDLIEELDPTKINEKTDMHFKKILVYAKKKPVLFMIWEIERTPAGSVYKRFAYKNVEFIPVMEECTSTKAVYQTYDEDRVPLANIGMWKKSLRENTLKSAKAQFKHSYPDFKGSLIIDDIELTV